MAILSAHKAKEEEEVKKQEEFEELLRTIRARKA